MPGSDRLRIWVFWKTVSWRQDAELKASGRQRASGPQWSRVEQPCQDEKEVLSGQYSSMSPSPAHLSHTTNINPFENKAWEVYLYKEVCSFVHWSRHYCWLCFRLYLYYVYVYVYLYMYVAIQQTHTPSNFRIKTSSPKASGRRPLRKGNEKLNVYFYIKEDGVYLFLNSFFIIFIWQLQFWHLNFKRKLTLKYWVIFTFGDWDWCVNIYIYTVFEGILKISLLNISFKNSPASDISYVGLKLARVGLD